MKTISPFHRSSWLLGPGRASNEDDDWKEILFTASKNSTHAGSCYSVAVLCCFQPYQSNQHPHSFIPALISTSPILFSRNRQAFKLDLDVVLFPIPSSSWDPTSMTRVVGIGRIIIFSLSSEWHISFPSEVVMTVIIRSGKINVEIWQHLLVTCNMTVRMSDYLGIIIIDTSYPGKN